MENQKFLGTALIIVFFVCVSMAWRASWNAARTVGPTVIDQAAEDDMYAVPKIDAAPLFAVPKSAQPKKQQAPAWGSFKVAGVAATAISLKQEFGGGKPSHGPDSAKKKADDKTKKKEVAKKKTEVKKVATAPTKPAPASKAGDDKMKPLEDKKAGAVAQVIAIVNNTPTQPAQDPAKKNGKRTAQDWEIFLTENTSLTKARTQEFITAYQSGQLVNDDEAGPAPLWMYSLLQGLYDHSERVVQESALRISKEVVTSDSFAVLVHNSERVDNSLRPKLTEEYQTYQELKRVRTLHKALFNEKRQVQLQALNVINTSAERFLFAAQQNGLPNQSAQASTIDPQDVFTGLLEPLNKLASDNREDPDVKNNATVLALRLNQRLNPP
ncbi:MAG: hypothetical protein ABL958_09185, partial [Bdellovibrionia bacterium]